MADIFLSYQRDDQARAEQVAKALGNLGWSVFWDRTIPPGESWGPYLKRQLDGASCVVVLWSDKAVESEWVLEEAHHGGAPHTSLDALAPARDTPEEAEAQTAQLVASARSAARASDSADATIPVGTAMTLRPMSSTSPVKILPPTVTGYASP